MTDAGIIRLFGTHARTQLGCDFGFSDVTRDTVRWSMVRYDTVRYRPTQTYFLFFVFGHTVRFMSSVTNEWASGDDLDIEVPGSPGALPAVVVRVSSESLHLRLTDEPVIRMPLEAGTPVSLRRMTEAGLIASDTTLMHAFVGEGPYVSVQKPNPASAVQRRGLFRMPTALPLTIQLKQATREDWVSRRVYHHLTADASGSGCSIETELPIEPGDRLRVTLWPDRPHAVVAGARVVWTGPSDWPGLKRAGLVFTTISTTGQDRLVGTLMEEERVRRRVLMDA